MPRPITPQEITERASTIEKMYHLDKRTNGLLNGLGQELETYLKWKRLLENE